MGKIPDHWTEKRTKYFYREADKRSTTGEVELLSVSHKTGVTPCKQSVTMFTAESTVGYKLCRPNDVTANTMWVFMGALGVSKQVGLVSPSYGVYQPIRPGDLLLEYVDRLLRVDGYKAEYMCRSTGINSSRLRLYPDDFLRVPIVCPPISEQAAIVRYLDHVDRRVRRLVRAKRKLIALLTEQKQAIIHRAATRGLDPDAPLKDPGVEWLREVPAHWEVRKLKSMTRFINGLPFKPSDWERQGTPIIRIQNLNGADGFNYTTRTDLPSSLWIKPGDLLFSWSGNRGTSFGSFIWDRKFAAYLNQHVFKLEGYHLNRNYLAYVLRAVTRHVEEEKTHGIIGLVHVTKPELGRVLVPAAPDEEQGAIAEYLEQTTADIGIAITRTNREIDLLIEYRTRLTADVVTGKLDVREAAAELPEVDPLAADDEPDILDAEAETDLDELDANTEEAEA